MKTILASWPRAVRGLCPLIATVLATPPSVQAQCNTFPAGGTLAGTINSYYAGSATAAAASRLVTVDTAYGVRPVGATAIAAGDLLLVVQMQDATINDTDTECYGDGTDEAPVGCTASLASGNGSGSNVQGSGLYEYVVAEAAIGVAVGICAPAANQVCITGGGAAAGLINSYTTASRVGVGAAQRGQRAFQVIRVPRYSTATLGPTLGAYGWDGRVGGVLAFDTSSTLSLGATTVSVDGQGFRGGVGQALTGAAAGLQAGYRAVAADLGSGLKGEGIAGTPSNLVGVPGGAGQGVPQGDRQRGAPGNAGGGGNAGNATNTENSGGGGGGNGGAGGHGGDTNATALTIGGWGGAAFPATIARLDLGGGGGAGGRNNAGPSDGAAGGGLVFIRAADVAGTGTITARGLNGACTANDGGGGGGAGGTIVFLAGSGAAFTAGTGPDLSNLTLIATGGVGADANTNVGCVAGSANAHGPGGGGGGGVVFHSDNVGAGPTVTVTGGANGVTRTPANPTGPFIAYNATPGAGGTSQTANPESVPGALTCFAVTRASLSGVRVSPGCVEFAATSQRGTRGFHVWAERDGRRQRVTEEMLAAPLPDATSAIVYRALVDVAGARRVWIEEVETGGRSRLLGPFEVGDERSAQGFSRIEERVLAGDVRESEGARMATRHHASRMARESGPGLRSPRRRAGRAVKVEVSGSGSVSVPLAELVQQGLPSALAAAPRSLRVSHLGQPVAFQVRDGRLLFRAEAFATDYTERGAYVVSGSDLRVDVRAGFTRSGPPLLPGLVRVQQDVFFAPFVDRSGDPWIWDVAASGVPAGPFSFDLPGLVPSAGTVRVRVHLLGGTEHEHHVRAEINDSFVGEGTVHGKGAGVVEGEIAGGFLREGGNELRLFVDSEGGADVGLVFLDAIDLGVVQRSAEAAVVERIAPFDPRVPIPAQTNYLIVTHDDFEDAARAIAERKRAEGFSPLVVDVERAYDRYSGGEFEGQAVRALVREVAERARLRNVLLVGDDTFDWRDREGMGLRSYVPSLMGWDGLFGRIPSDNLYVDLNGDGSPDVAIGRLPVQTADEAAVMVDKLSRQREVLRELAGRDLVAVDNAGPGDISFRGEAERSLGGAIGAVWADVKDGVAPARELLLRTWQAGAQTTSYFGHAGHDRWADELLLGLDDVDELGGTGRETVLFTWTCEAQWYQYDGGRTINEALLLLPRGGALASLGPVGISQPDLQSALSESVYRRFRSGATLGESLRAAKADLLRANPEAGPVVDGFTLLGDPSLRLPSARRDRR